MRVKASAHSGDATWLGLGLGLGLGIRLAWRVACDTAARGPIAKPGGAPSVESIRAQQPSP